PTLTTTMKSVGEAMAIGRNFTEALQKALRSLEQKGSELAFPQDADPQALLAAASTATTDRLSQTQQALYAGATIEEAFEATAIDP
ncbi:hypothetical protein GUG69_28540, partial [Xanthomonas citri pv. citri]|nr:hypothetical protein [Xanthomonas citri pv. citri]